MFIRPETRVDLPIFDVPFRLFRTGQVETHVQTAEKPSMIQKMAYGDHDCIRYATRGTYGRWPTASLLCHYAIIYRTIH